MLLTAALVPVSQLLGSFTLPLHLLGSILTMLMEPFQGSRDQSPERPIS